MGCVYCGERDESGLILSSRVVNGRVEQELICSNCIWRDEFVHKVKGEDGNALSEKLRERADKSTVSARSLDSFGSPE